MQKEFQFLKVVDRTESEVLCMLCDGKFNVADGGRTSVASEVDPFTQTRLSRIQIQSIINKSPLVSFTLQINK